MAGMTTTTLSSKGQLVIPTALRRALRLEPGDRLRVSLQDGRLVLEPEQAQPARLMKERGRRVLVAPPSAPAMTTGEVKKLLSDFP
jgi:AbrB family looped-hinge helix DNA binding protein